MYVLLPKETMTDTKPKTYDCFVPLASEKQFVNVCKTLEFWPFYHTISSSVGISCDIHLTEEEVIIMKLGVGNIRLMSRRNG